MSYKSTGKFCIREEYVLQGSTRAEVRLFATQAM
jgi:hypothetical protein